MVPTKKPVIGALCAVLCAAALALPPRPALACGDSETGSCGDASAAADEARWMLTRVATAVRAEPALALDWFARGQGGFRTAEAYVFCIHAGDGRITAHPLPGMIGRDARALHAPYGTAAAEMLDVARDGAITPVRVHGPRLAGGMQAPRTAYVIRAGDQVCGMASYAVDMDF